jgi:hypothetical protein
MRKDELDKHGRARRSRRAGNGEVQAPARLHGLRRRCGRARSERERERELGEEESSCREEQGLDGFYRERALGRERYGRRVQDAIDGVHQWGEGVMGEGEETDALQLITR